MSLGVALLRRERVVAAGRGKCWLNVSTTAALATMLTACGDHAGATIPTVNAPSATFSHHQTFQFTGKPQRFKVPHVRWLRVVVQGAGGAGSSNDVARGGRVYALIPASIDKELVVYVGGTGSLTEGGYNGGADGGSQPLLLELQLRWRRRIRHSPRGRHVGRSRDRRRRRWRQWRWQRRLAPVARAEAAAAAPAEAEAPVPDRATATAPVRAVAADHKAPAGPAVSGAAMIVATAEASVMVEPAAQPYYGEPGGGGGGGGFYGGGGGGGGATGYSSYYGSGGGGGGGGGSSYVGKRATHSHVWQGWKNAVGDGLVVISW